MTPDPALTFAQEALGCRRFASYGPCATRRRVRLVEPEWRDAQ